MKKFAASRTDWIVEAVEALIVRAPRMRRIANQMKKIVLSINSWSIRGGLPLAK
jgi:hypothetical protein